MSKLRREERGTSAIKSDRRAMRMASEKPILAPSASRTENRPDVQALEQDAPGVVLGQFLDRDGGLHAPDVGLAQHQLLAGHKQRLRPLTGVMCLGSASLSVQSDGDDTS
jgi:hypothetical protein